MKRFLLLLTLCLALPLCTLAEEVFPGWKAGGSKAVDSALLTDGSDETHHAFSSAKAFNLTAALPEGETIQALYLRMDRLPDRLELQQKNSKNKWETVAVLENPGAECVLLLDAPLGGSLRLSAAFPTQKATRLTELRAFSNTQLPDGLHVWQPAREADVLLTLDKLTGADLSGVSAWADQGRSVAVASLSFPADPLCALDALWDAGVRTAPLFGPWNESTRSTSRTLESWGSKKVAAEMCTWLRTVRPLLVVDGGEITALTMAEARRSALDPDTALKEAAALGVWAAVSHITAADDAAAALRTLPDRADYQMRDVCIAAYAGAVCADPSLIPYPENRDAEGYLTQGEFVWEDEALGQWAYLSPTVQVEILRYDMQDPCQRYFLAEVRFKPEAESFRQHTWVNATLKNHHIYPQTLAQSSRLVIGINGDFYPYRMSNKHTVGNIIRDYEVLSTMDMRKNPQFPTLDTLALHDDGDFTVYGAKEITAQELADLGTVHDALSFGPYMARDGELRIFDGKNASSQDPRSALGMVAPGHYFLLNCEGRIPKGAEGMTINEVGMLLYAAGCTDTFMVDGGSTAVLLFMGKQLNQVGKNSSVGSSRNLHELFGVGHSELVHTDWMNGKP